MKKLTNLLLIILGFLIFTFSKRNIGFGLFSPKGDNFFKSLKKSVLIALNDILEI